MTCQSNTLAKHLRISLVITAIYNNFSNLQKLIMSRSGGTYITISPKYTFLIVHLHKWTKITVTHYEYRYTLQMFLHIIKSLVKAACFVSCVRLADWPVYDYERGSKHDDR